MQNEPQGNYIRGVLMIIISAFCFACMNICIRLSGSLPSIQKSFFRNLVAACFAGIILRHIRFLFAFQGKPGPP